jgi:hypothetical protein
MREARRRTVCAGGFAFQRRGIQRRGIHPRCRIAVSVAKKHRLLKTSADSLLFRVHTGGAVLPDERPDQDIRKSLARAFDRAWAGYYRAGQLTISEDVARTELARRLVQLSREGLQDEGKLANAGLLHLRQLSFSRRET